MELRNSETQYGVVTKTFHWVMALFIIDLLIAGLIMGDIEDLPLKFKVYGLHKSFGITVLTLAFLRIVWHLVSKKPALVSGMKKIEELAAHAMHIFLYIAMIGMPMSGWLLSSAAGRTVSVFGLFSLPDFVEKNEELRDTFGEVHEILGYALIACIVLHAAAALKHHFINKDITLRRMLPF